MTEMPRPEAETMKISTISRLLLKYWPTIREAVSRVIPAPTPGHQKAIRSLSLIVNEAF